jgi:hypothetical protein
VRTATWREWLRAAQGHVVVHSGRIHAVRPSWDFPRRGKISAGTSNHSSEGRGESFTYKSSGGTSRASDRPGQGRGLHQKPPTYQLCKTVCWGAVALEQGLLPTLPQARRTTPIEDQDPHCGASRWLFRHCCSTVARQDFTILTPVHRCPLNYRRGSRYRERDMTANRTRNTKQHTLTQEHYELSTTLRDMGPAL